MYNYVSVFLVKIRVAVAQVSLKRTCVQVLINQRVLY